MTENATPETTGLALAEAEPLSPTKDSAGTKKKLIIRISAIGAALVLAGLATAAIGNASAENSAKSDYERAVQAANDAETASKATSDKLTNAGKIEASLAALATAMPKDKAQDATGLFDAKDLTQLATDTAKLVKANPTYTFTAMQIKHPETPTTTEAYKSATNALTESTKPVTDKVSTVSADTDSLVDANKSVSTDFVTLAKSVPAQSAALLKANPKAEKASVDAFNEAVKAVAAVKPESAAVPEIAYVKPIQDYIGAAKNLKASQAKAEEAEKAHAEDAAKAKAAEEAATAASDAGPAAPAAPQAAAPQAPTYQAPAAPAAQAPTYQAPAAPAAPAPVYRAPAVPQAPAPQPRRRLRLGAEPAVVRPEARSSSLVVAGTAPGTATSPE